jgi:hypothetical protein
VLFEKSGRTLLCCPEGKGGDYAIPGTVTAIDHEAFTRCRELTGVRIPASVTAIGQGVFTGSRLNFIHVEAANTRFSSADGVLFNKNKSKLICCPARKKGDYAIPGTVTEIGEDAFFWCNGLTSVVIPGSVITIGSHAFTFCVLTSVTIPDSVVTVGAWAFGPFNNKLTSVTIGKSMSGDYFFWGCSKLISIRVDVANAWLCSEDGVLFDKEKKTLLCYPGGRAGDYVIPGSVTAIGDHAFDGNKGLASVVIPGSVTEIGEGAFEGCSGLISVMISDSVTAIGRDAFNSCTGLTSVTIPGSVTAIGEGAFNSCFGLTSVVIPGSVTTIGESAFSRCNRLTSVVIHDSVTAIGRSAFRFCRCLTSVVIPGSVTTIGESAFGYSSLSTFTNFSLVPQEIDRCFDDVDVRACTLRVPAGAVGAYKAAPGWGEFGQIVAIEDES